MKITTIANTIFGCKSNTVIINNSSIFYDEQQENASEKDTLYNVNFAFTSDILKHLFVLLRRYSLY
jgi:hypothetical protein